MVTIEASENTLKKIIMIIVFNWKDKTPVSYQQVFLYYQQLAEKLLLIVCPQEEFLQTKFAQFSKLNIKYCLQKPEVQILQSLAAFKFDYVMLNHQRFKEFLDANKINLIAKFNKKPIICFSAINEIEKIKDINAMWAYEPEQNIGSSADLNLDEILMTLNNLSRLNLKGQLLYGGGVRTDNFPEIYQKIGHLVDGFLIGEKSVEPDFLKNFVKLVLNIGKHNQNIVCSK
jgi:triosephosphate isomerase